MDCDKYQTKPKPGRNCFCSSVLRWITRKISSQNCRRRLRVLPRQGPAGASPPPSMSLNRLKETLHACSSSSSEPRTQPRSPQHPARLPRRPPKTSLSQQLLRLEAAASSSSSFSSRPLQLPPAPRPPIEKPREDVEPPSSEDEDERKSRPIIRRCLHPPPAAALESRGPYEPLVLSLPGEHPVVQVPYCACVSSVAVDSLGIVSQE